MDINLEITDEKDGTEGFIAWDEENHLYRLVDSYFEIRSECIWQSDICLNDDETIKLLAKSSELKLTR
ncbi:hypothetical protein [Metaclostridioides mangenotii]|uniref:hypothetical protein n=1 Tax=Metaclostridioides mangenotii TaxID=1540 RepID=UPI0026EDD0CC|nr:hypothetical protein [Clostridioides mangenotii]